MQNLIDELKIYKGRYKARKICFEDDNLATDKKWLEEFSCYYAKEINLPFFCNISPSLIDEETAGFLKKAGCNHLYVGVDSSNEFICKNVAKRNVSQETLRKNIAIIKKHKIPLELSMIFGWPHETPEDMWQGVKLIDELDPVQVQSHVLYPYPGTDMLTYCQKIGLVDGEILSRIYKGEGGMVVQSILNHPYKDLAYVISKLLPLYIKTPKFLKPLVKKLIHPRMKKIANIIHVAAIPFLYPLLAKTRIREILLMLMIAIKMRFFRKGDI